MQEPPITLKLAYSNPEMICCAWLGEAGTKSDEIWFYTFVIIDGEWRFSPTSKSGPRNFLSKHAVHSNCAEAVTYSGEMHFEKHETDIHMVMHNSSGTYKPHPECLPQLKWLMESNFPGLIVDTFCYDDDELLRRLELVNEHNKKCTSHPILSSMKKSPRK